MTPYQAARIRFGVLAARDEWERHRLTPEQTEDLEGMEFEGWRVIDSIRAYRRERDNAVQRIAANL